MIRLWTLAALVLLLATGAAEARHRHRWGGSRHRVVLARSGALGFYHCPSGQYWRPSLNLCQGSPYRGERLTPRLAQAARWPAASASPASPDSRSATAQRVVDTHTRVIGRQRRVVGGAVTVSYVVETRVVERYPAPGLRRP